MLARFTMTRHSFRHSFRLPLAGLLLAAAGCATAPDINFYTLDMATAATAAPPVNLLIGPLRAHEALARRDILIKTSSTEIEYYATDQWVAGLDQLVAEKLAAELPPVPDAAKSLEISGDILAFEQIDTSDGAQAHVKLAIEFRTPGESHYASPALHRTYDVRLPAESASAGAVVQALSRCLEQIAAQIARDAADL